MRIPFIAITAGGLLLAGCGKKDGEDTGSDGGGGICRTPEVPMGWYCVEYSGSDWSFSAAEEDCDEVYVDGEWAASGACDEEMIGTCDIAPDTSDTVVVHMYGLELDVAEAACDALGGTWTGA